MKRGKILLAILALTLVFCAGIGSAMAYFTTYTQAKGGQAITLGSNTALNETFSAWTKHVTVSSAEGSAPVFVRAMAFGSNRYELSCSSADNLWSLGADGWYYYTEPLNGGETTGELLVKIENVPTEGAEGDSFNVIVVYESTPAQYRADGNAYADWDAKLIGGGEGGSNG